jgi:type I restriction enzyme M protein
MHWGNTITEDFFQGQTFGYQITNPPYGKSWKTDKDKIYHEKQLLDSRFELTLPVLGLIGEEKRMSLECKV